MVARDAHKRKAAATFLDADGRQSGYHPQLITKTGRFPDWW
jgi:hypothetical protein